MALSSLYMDTPRVDISGTLANLRKEESDRKAKNWKSAQDLLRGAATDAIRSKYADQIDWEQGVEYADKVFKVQYERLMAVDPQAAAQLAQEYKIEREKRVNKQISDAYKRQEEDPELKALEAEIASLQANIQASESQQVINKAAENAGITDGMTTSIPDTRSEVETPVTLSNVGNAVPPGALLQMYRDRPVVQETVPSTATNTLSMNRSPANIIPPVSPTGIPGTESAMGTYGMQGYVPAEYNGALFGIANDKLTSMAEDQIYGYRPNSPGRTLSALYSKGGM